MALFVPKILCPLEWALAATLYMDNLPIISMSKQCRRQRALDLWMCNSILNLVYLNSIYPDYLSQKFIVESMENIVNKKYSREYNIGK